MTFATRDLLDRVISACTRHGAAFHALAIETPGGRVFMPSRRAAHTRPDGVMKALPVAALTPEPEVIIDALPVRVLLRQHAPLDASDDEVEQGVDDLAHL